VLARCQHYTTAIRKAVSPGQPFTGHRDEREG